MTKEVIGNKNTDITNRGSLEQLTIEELLWYARKRRQKFSFKDCLIDYILKINQ